MDEVTKNAILRIAAHNLTRDLASLKRTTPREVAQDYILEAYYSMNIGGPSYVQGLSAFADNLVDVVITEYQTAQSAPQ